MKERREDNNEKRVNLTPRLKKMYEKIIEEATMDCSDEYEQIAGWECAFDEKIAAPCSCKIGKQQAMLEKVSMDDNSGAVIGVIRINKSKMRILIQDIIIEDSEAMKYIDAYKYWCKNGL